MSPRLPGRARHPARGFTLIEVMISILIFAVGILGAVGMQARALQTSTQNQDRARAAVLANDIVSTAWALQTIYLTASSSSTYVSDWKTRVKTPTASGLPNGVGIYTPDYPTTGYATVTITWQAPSASSSSKYTTVFNIP